MDPVNVSRGIRYGFSVAVAVFAFGLLLPLYTTVVPAARVQVDPVYQRSGGGHSYGRPLTPKKFGRALAGMDALFSFHEQCTLEDLGRMSMQDDQHQQESKPQMNLNQLSGLTMSDP
ncbi:MAG: hypothetical protein Q9193_004617 [Seirophora villosa]